MPNAPVVAALCAGVASVAHAADDADAGPFASLLDKGRIVCEFGPGNGAGWPDGRLWVHDAEYQGGTTTIDFDLAQGTARVSGSVDTPEGFLDGQFHRRSGALHFIGFTPDGSPIESLIVMTVFAAKDVDGLFVAVMSRHTGIHGDIVRGSGPPDLDSEYHHWPSQFYGACE